MNVSNLILQLKNEVNSCAADQQMISKAIKLLELGAVFNATSFSTLPAASANSGRLYFVNFDGLYFSTGSFWLPIVKTDYSVIFGSGPNTNGNLGDLTAINRSSPVLGAPQFTDWNSISAGSYFSLGIRSNGTLWAWGNNGSGRLGDGTTTTTSSPVSVIGGFTDWCLVGAGRGTSLGIRSNGTLWAWGCAEFGKLGDNSTVNKSSPVSVIGGFSDWCQLSAGYDHVAAIRTNGTLWSWGNGSQGRLGDNTAVSKSSPVSVVGGFTDWRQVSAGNNFSLAVRTNGSAWAWGCGYSGRLGNNCTTDRSSPVSVVGGFTDWCQVSAGSQHSLGLRTNGSLWGWGYAAQGQLGNNSTSNRSSPVSVVGGFTDWCQVSGGSNWTSAIRTNGTLWAWGTNSSGQFGDGTVTGKSSPVSALGGFTDWCRLSERQFFHTVAIRRKTLT